MFQIFRSFGWVAVASHASVEPSDKIIIVGWWPVCGALLYLGRVIWPAQNWTIRGNQIIFSCKSVEAVNWILPADAARLGVQVSGAVKYPVLEVKWQQKLWLEPWNNQSRCFDCWEPAKNCPGFAAARAPQTVIKPFAGKLLLLSASHYTLQTPWLQDCHDVTIMICSHALWRCQQNFTIAYTKFREGAY